MTGFDDATAVHRVGPVSDGTWTCAAELDPDWRVGTKPNGGYLIAVMTRAALEGAGHGELPPHPVAVSAQFLRSPQVGAVTIEVELARSGVSVAQLRTTLIQSGRRCVDALVTLGTLTADDGHWWDGVDTPTLPAEAGCPLADGSRPELPVPMLSVVEERFDPTTVGWAAGRPGGSSELRGWVRHADGRQPDPLSLVQVVDALPPATFDLGAAGWVPTLSLTAYIRALPSPGSLVVRQRARLVTGGLLDEQCDVWDATGRLVATGHQLAALRVPAVPPVAGRF